MKKLKRIVLSITSTVLLFAGFARAADKLDPLGDNQTASKRTVAPTPDTVNACDLMDEQR